MAKRRSRAGEDAAQRSRSARFRRVFGTADGKKVLGEILEHCGVGQPLFAADPRVQERKVALHDAGIWIREQMKQQGETDEH